ncbi:MAG: DUF3592 domain-containing protein [Nocardia sp.]|nr:DUF3592 domain-containing protein [Nocardia sp.]
MTLSAHMTGPCSAQWRGAATISGVNMHVVWGLVGAAIGVLLVYETGSEVVGHIRRRARLIRTTATVVGAVDSDPKPASVGRSAVFRFRTGQGEVIDATSSFYAGRGPRVGRELGIVYDGARPHDFAERRGVVIGRLILAAPLMALGIFLAVDGLRSVFGS